MSVKGLWSIISYLGPLGITDCEWIFTSISIRLIGQVCSNSQPKTSQDESRVQHSSLMPSGKTRHCFQDKLKIIGCFFDCSQSERNVVSFCKDLLHVGRLDTVFSLCENGLRAKSQPSFICPLRVFHTLFLRLDQDQVVLLPWKATHMPTPMLLHTTNLLLCSLLCHHCCEDDFKGK